MRLSKVISGGQTGADLAGLKAAQFCGIDTGGLMPLGFKNHEGCHPEYAVLYQVEEDSSSEYTPRTRKNVEMADATVRFATEWFSPGEKATLKYIREFSKPSFGVDPTEHPDPTKFAAWLRSYRVRTLNVAGNAERTSPGIGDFTFNFLVTTFNLLKLDDLIDKQATE